MKKIVFFTLLVFCAGFLALAADAVNVAGKWKVTMTTPRGERVTEYTIVQTGDKLSLTWAGREGQEQKAEGTLKGNEIQWSFTREGPQGSFTMTYKGTVEGDTMKGTADSPMGAIDWKGEKIPPAK